MTTKREFVPQSFIEVREKGRRHQNVTAVRRYELVVTSGSIVACDPSAGKATRPAAERVKPGKYPVFLYASSLAGAGFAELRFSEEPVTRWEKASSYDSLVGFGCFADQAAALREHYLRVEDDGSGDYVDDVLNEALKNEGGQYRTRPRAKENVVLFTSAYSDIVWRCYRGFDARGRLACVVADAGSIKPEPKPSEVADMGRREFAEALAEIRKTLGSALVGLGFSEGAPTYTSERLWGTRMCLPFEKGRFVIRVEARHISSSGTYSPNIWIGGKGRKAHFDDLANIAMDAGVKKIPPTDELERFGDVAKMLTRHFAAIEPKLEGLLEKSRIEAKKRAKSLDKWLASR